MSFPGRAVQRAWHLVDASGQTVGRLAAQIAPILKGKHKPTFQPGKDMGDYVVIINAEEVHLTADKWEKKLYRKHSGYPGGLTTRTAAQLHERNPTTVLEKAIMGMVKRTKMRHMWIEPRLFIYPGPEHPHTAQLPEGRAVPLRPVPSTLTGGFHFGMVEYTQTPGGAAKQKK